MVMCGVKDLGGGASFRLVLVTELLKEHGSGDEAGICGSHY